MHFVTGKSMRVLQGNGEDDRKESEAVKRSVLEYVAVKKAIKVSRLRSALFENLQVTDIGMR